MSAPPANPADSTQRYRPDIDGLRALAVTLVVLCHLRTRLVGGFVGVDVFFVISGYLISGHILSAFANGSFSLVDFYERRVRRILPALLAMMAVCGLVAYQLLAPVDLEKYARSMLAALFSVSNVYFLHNTNYFAGLSSEKPLLHTWSLGVEEQFYLFFPLVLLVLARGGLRWLRPAIWTLLLASFAASCWYVKHDASTAFYLLPMRAWELLVGTVLSQGYLPRPRKAWSRNVASALGVALIVASAWWLTPESPFPAWNALAPCVGAALLIAAGENGSSLLGGVLSWRPVVFVGAISYSLYLWHWPVIVFGSMPELTHVREFTFRLKVAWALISVVLAVLSWALVEQPFRRGRLRPGRKNLFGIAGVSVAMLALLGVVALRTDGFASRFSPNDREVMAYKPWVGRDYREGACFFTPPEQFSEFKEQECLRNVPAEPQVLLVGDSMAAQLYVGLQQAFLNWNISQITSAGCAPILGWTRRMDGLFLSNCQEMLDRMQSYLSTHHPALVLLGGDWKEDELGPLADTIAWLHEHGQRVAVYGPVPDFDADLPGLIALASRRADPDQFLASHRVPETQSLDRQMAELAAQRWKTPYVSAFGLLCTVHDPKVMTSGDGCPVVVSPGVPFLWDFHHFGPEASRLYAERVRDQGLLGSF